VNLKDAIRRRIDFVAPNGKEYKLDDEVATLLVRPRGWHLDEKHLMIDGLRLSGSLFDFGLYFFHNAQELLNRGLGPYFYLPKLQSHLEARLWNDVFVFAQEELGIPRGSIKATVLIETIPAAFEMEEILWELREHSAGLNAGRWDYIFSCIKTYQQASPQTIQGPFCFPDRSMIKMDVPFMRAYCLSMVQTCHKRKAPAIGGMSALIPIKDDAAANEKAMGGIRDDKARDAADGFDGGWVAHPGLVGLAMSEFVKVLGDKCNQVEKQITDYKPEANNILDFQPTEPLITEQGLRSNVRVGVQYLASWLGGVGCVPIHNLMEDAATAEISRSQVWQWIHSPKGILQDGRKVDGAMVQSIMEEELASLKKLYPNVKTFDTAAQIFSHLAYDSKFEEFLTLPLYETF
jgi:malate synthase